MDSKELENILVQIQQIKINLGKLGISRRTKEVLDYKVRQARSLYAEAHEIVGEIEKSEISDEEAIIVNALTSKISSTVSEIVEFAKRESKNTECTMSAFDLKMAVSLLPMMDDTEEKTTQLIDAIDLYHGMLNEDSKPLLVSFILKTRLTRSAKIRLSNTYDSVDSLLDDMKKHLLTRKSDTALQAQLTRARQGGKNIENFGKELEELFVNLTISQANGDNSLYSVLKPINERNAIKTFADGLRNPRLSTIVAARNFMSLKDAIRCAKDEEVSRPDSQIMTIRGRGRGSNASFRGHYQHRGRGNFYPNRNFTNSYSQSRGGNNGNFSRGRNNSNSNNSTFNNRNYNVHSANKNNNYRGQQSRGHSNRVNYARSTGNMSRNEETFFRAHSE